MPSSPSHVAFAAVLACSLVCSSVASIVMTPVGMGMQSGGVADNNMTWNATRIEGVWSSILATVQVRRQARVAVVMLCLTHSCMCRHKTAMLMGCCLLRILPSYHHLELHLPL